jgi:hypothetical protein
MESRRTRQASGSRGAFRLYVQSQPCLFDKSNIPKQNLFHRSNVISDGSPSRMRMVRRISLGITTRPRSSHYVKQVQKFLVFSKTSHIKGSSSLPAQKAEQENLRFMKF